MIRVIPIRNGAAAGEASDASMIVMDGVVTADGGSVGNGFGVNPSAHDGFLTSNQLTANGKPMASVQTFDQTSNSILATVTSSSDAFATIGAGIYGLDTGVFSDFNPSTNATSYSVLNPLSQGAITAQWTPPLSSGLQLLGSANDRGDATGVFLAADPSALPSPVFDIFSSNIVTNSSSSLVDVISALPPPPDQQFGGVWEVTGVAADKANGRAILIVAEFQPEGGSYFPSCLPPLVVTVDIATGKVTFTKAPGIAAFYGAAFDSENDIAALPSNRCALEGLAIHDLRTGHNTITTLPGVYSVYPAADATHRLFLIQSLFGADGFGDTNNNALSTITVLSESGQIVHVLERFNFFNEATVFDPNLPLNNYLAPSAGYAPLQVVPSRRTGYVPSRTLTQLEPFNY